MPDSCSGLTSCSHTLQSTNVDIDPQFRSCEPNQYVFVCKALGAGKWRWHENRNLTNNYCGHLLFKEKYAYGSRTRPAIVMTHAVWHIQETNTRQDKESKTVTKDRNGIVKSGGSTRCGSFDRARLQFEVSSPLHIETAQLSRYACVLHRAIHGCGLHVASGTGMVVLPRHPCSDGCRGRLPSTSTPKQG